MSTTQKRNIPWGALGPWLALLVTCLFFTTQSERFLTAENLSLVLQQVMVVGVLAIGQSLIILTAGIDLSCGMVMALGGVVMTKFAVNYGMDPYAAIVCGLAVTTGFGLINGLLVTRLRLPPFIVTLGTLNIAFAITQIYSESQTITNLPAAMTTLGNTFNLGSTEVSLGTVTMLFLYALAGLFYGIAAMLSVARTGVGDPNAGQTENLDAITAVVLGGTSLFGGRGIILGTLVGALIVGVFRNGLTLMGVSSVYQILVTGILVILAVMTDQMSRKGVR